MSRSKKRKLTREEREERESVKRLEGLLSDYRNSWSGIMLFTALGLIILVYALIMFISSPNYSSYLPVSALITGSESTPIYRESGQYGRAISYRITINFLYQLEGQDIEKAITITSSRDYSRSLYQANREITIYYNPENREQITLNPQRLGIMHLAMLIAGATSLAVGIGGTFNRRFQIKRIKESLAKKRGVL